MASSDFWSRSGIFTLIPGCQNLIAFKNDSANRMATYKGFLRRPKFNLSIIDGQNLKLLQKLGIPDSTYVDVTAIPNVVFASSFDSIYIYKK